MTERRVSIWRTNLLPGSETFIRNQVDRLESWSPEMLGAMREQSPLALPGDTIVFRGSAIGSLRYRLFRVFRRSPAVFRALQGQRPDLVHAHFAQDGWRISPAARRLRVPLVVTLHGQDVTKMPAADGSVGRRARKRLRQLFNEADLLIAVSEFIRGEAIGWGADPAKVVVHYIGIPLPDAPAVDTIKEWDAVFVGRLVEKKGVSDLLKAVRKASDLIGRNLSVAVIGDGPQRVALEAEALSLAVDVRFQGSRTPSEVRTVIASARMFIGPSKRAPNGDAEGLPTVYMEAAALAVPAVGYRHAGIPEFVVEGETGLLADEGDIKTLSEHIASLMRDPERGERMGRLARARVSTEFSIVSQTAALEELYDRTVAGYHH